MSNNSTIESVKVEFDGAFGDRLAARLDLPDGSVRGYALFAHCFTCSKDIHAASRVARALTDSGFAVLRFDFTGLGHSDGEFANTNFSSNIEDLVRAADYLRTNHQAPGLLIGHSLGGAAVLAAAKRIPEVLAVVTIGAPADPAHILKLINPAITTIEAAGSATVSLGGRPFIIQQQFLRDLETQPQDQRIATLGAALLVIHSPIDQTVSIDNARHIFDVARHPKSFVALDGADHLLTDPDDARFVANTIALWAARYLPATAPAPAVVVADALELEGPPAGVVRVAETPSRTFAQIVTTGSHILLADEPVPIGTDTGPSPYDYVLAGLGACTSMTIRLYANRKKWPLDNVTVDLRHSRVHADDCANCDTAAPAIDHIDRTIVLRGDLTDAQRQSLLVIADKCPVHRTLHAGVVVTTTLV